MFRWVCNIIHFSLLLLPTHMMNVNLCVLFHVLQINRSPTPLKQKQAAMTA